MTPAQLQTLRAAIDASTDPAVIAARTPETRDDNAVRTWLNSAHPTAMAWQSAMTARPLFEASDITKFDALTAGKRDAWRLLLDFAPIDFNTAQNRKAIADVWGNADGVAVLQACRRAATVAENALGGNTATTNTVAALKLNFAGTVSLDDTSNALNLAV